MLPLIWGLTLLNGAVCRKHGPSSACFLCRQQAGKEQAGSRQLSDAASPLSQQVWHMEEPRISASRRVHMTLYGAFPDRPLHSLYNLTPN